MTVELQYQRANETPAHYALKQAAVAWLYVRGCWPMGQEIKLGHHHFVDAFGMKVGQQGLPLWPEEFRRSNRVMMYGIQVKVSRSDARRRWRVPVHVLYMLTPPGLLDPAELPPEVGLLEADPAKVRVRIGSHGMPVDVDGIRIVRRARVIRDLKDPVPPGFVALSMARSFAARMLRGLPLAEWG